MDTFFNLSFGESDTPEICYNAKSELTSQDFVDSLLQQPVRASALQPDDLLEELLSTAEAEHVVGVGLDNVQTFCCEICGKGFDKILKYYGHLRIHSKDNVWQCGKCQLKFSTKHQLVKHDLEHNPRVFPCPQCPMTFKVSSRLQQHILYKHLNHRVYKCDECDKTCFKASDLKKHKDIHYGISRHSCPHCTANFREKSNLNRHILTHTNEKPFMCVGCGYKYKQSANLNRHKQKCVLYKNKIAQDTHSAPAPRENCKTCGMKMQFNSVLLQCVSCTKAEEEKNNLTNDDTGKTVDSLVDDILSVEDEYSILNTNTPLPSNNDVMNVGLDEEQHIGQDANQDSNLDNIWKIEFLNEMNHLNSLDDELLYNDIDLDSFQSSLVFDMNGSDYDYTALADNNAEICFDFGDCDKSVDWPVNALCETNEALMSNPMLNDAENSNKEIKEKDDSRQLLQTDPTVSVNDCSTIFETDVDLEEGSNLAVNLNQLIGENNVQYISTEDDDTFIISLNSAIDAEQLTDLLNIGLEVVDENKSVDKCESVRAETPKEEEVQVVSQEKPDEPKIEETNEIKPKEKLYVCKTCKKQFKKKDNYMSHLGTHSAALRRHVCSECGARFSYRSTLCKHIAKHKPASVSPIVTCNLCDKTYKAAWLLKNHVERDHLGLKPYACNINGCNKKFYKQFDLVIHKRFHTGERAYQCDICNKGFPHASHLKRHVRFFDCTKRLNKNKILTTKKPVAKTKTWKESQDIILIKTELKNINAAP